MMKFDEMMKPFNYGEAAKNAETMRNRFFDNAETVVKTFYGISEGNLKMAREMTDPKKAKASK